MVDAALISALSTLPPSAGALLLAYLMFRDSRVARKQYLDTIAAERSAYLEAVASERKSIETFTDKVTSHLDSMRTQIERQTSVMLTVFLSQLSRDKSEEGLRAVTELYNRPPGK